jgi:hypothetical protein
MPRGAVSADDFFDTPWWNRPTADNPYGGDGGGGDPVLDGPGFNGEGPDYTTGGSPGFDGIPPINWTAPSSGDPYDGGTVTLPPATINITASRTHVYRIEVYDEDNDRLAVVDKWFGGKLFLALDQANSVQFSITADDAAAALMVRPNVIKVRDRWGFLVDTFVIQQTAGRRVGDAVFLDVQCASYIAQLGEEPVVLYEGEDVDGEGLTVAQHIAGLLALQIRPYTITLGDLDDAIGAETFVFHAQDTTVLNALRQLQSVLAKDLAGHFYVDANRRLVWTLVMDDKKERYLGLGANLQGLRYKTDWTQLVNRIYLYGEGQDEATRLRLTDAGEAEEYMEDASSVSTYGLNPKVKIDRRVRKPETLVRIANRVLEEFGEPRIVVEVDAIDLAKSDEYSHFEDIYIGSQYRVVDTAQGVDTTVDVVAMEIDMGNPMPVRLELTNQERRLGDLFGDMLDALTQPLDVDGERYPTMGRNYSTEAERLARAGDVRWSGVDDRGEMHDGTDWQELAGTGIPIYFATSKAGLESGVEAHALGFITAGTAAAAWYERNADNDGWVGRTIWEAP